MKKALLSIMVLLLVLTPVLASCNRDPVKSDETSPTDDYTVTENTCYIWWEGDNTAQTVITTAIVDFLEAHPEHENKDIKAYTPAEMDRHALEVNIAGQTAPQIVKMDHVYISALGSKGNLENLLDPRFDFGKEESKFIPSCWEAVKYKDKIYGIPFDANTIAFLYNEDLLNQAGKSVPKTYEEIIEVGRAVKALNLDGTYGYTLSFNDRNNWSTFNFLFWLWRLGGDVLNEDYTKATFNGREGQEALSRYIDIVKTEQIAKPDGYGEGDFGAGKVAMMDMGLWYITSVANNPSWKFAPMPVLKEGIPGHSGLGLFALSVVSEEAGNKNVELSYQFAKHLGTTTKYQVDYCKDKDFIPSLVEGANDPFFNTEVYKIFVDQLKIAKARPGVACWPQIEEAIHEALNDVLLHGRSATEALNAAATRVDQLLAGEMGITD